MCWSEQRAHLGFCQPATKGVQKAVFNSLSLQLDYQHFDYSLFFAALTHSLFLKHQLKLARFGASPVSTEQLQDQQSVASVWRGSPLSVLILEEWGHLFHWGALWRGMEQGCGQCQIRRQ